MQLAFASLTRSLSLTAAPALALALTLGSGACGGGDSAPRVDAGPVSYQNDIKPIFDALCVDCHRPGAAIDYNFVDPFDPVNGIINRENSWFDKGARQEVIVDPGNPGNSFLVAKVADPNLDYDTSGNTMPMLIDRLTQAEMDAVAQWITDGAQDDAFFRDEVAPIFGTEVTLRRQSGKCTWCHFPGVPNGLSVIDVFDPVEGMVDVDSQFGGKIVLPGDPENSVLMQKLESPGPAARMPLHPRRLTEQEVQLITDWIAQGAQNN
jgi:mono/diheme cytochrome c family protein